MIPAPTSKVTRPPSRSSIFPDTGDRNTMARPAGIMANPACVTVSPKP